MMTTVALDTKYLSIHFNETANQVIVKAFDVLTYTTHNATRDLNYIKDILSGFEPGTTTPIVGGVTAGIAVLGLTGYACRKWNIWPKASGSAIFEVKVPGNEKDAFLLDIESGAMKQMLDETFVNKEAALRDIICEKFDDVGPRLLGLLENSSIRAVESIDPEIARSAEKKMTQLINKSLTQDLHGSSVVPGPHPGMAAEETPLPDSVDEFLKVMHSHTLRLTEHDMRSTFKNLQKPSEEVSSKMMVVKMEARKDDADMKTQRGNTTTIGTNLYDVKLLKMHDTHEETVPNHVMICGDTGAGKTTLAKRYAWLIQQSKATTQNIGNIELVHFTKVSKLETSVERDAFSLLFTQQVGAPLTKDLQQAGRKWLGVNTENTSLVFNGLDQCGTQLATNITADDPSTASVILCNIFSGHLYPGIKILLTSHWHTYWALTNELKPAKTMALHGLDEQNMELLIISSCGESRGQSIFKHLHGKVSNLFPLYKTPTFLLYVSGIYMQDSSDPPDAITAVMVSVLKYFFRPSHKTDKHSIPNLMKLAFIGMMDNQFIFSQNYISQLELDITNPKDLVKTNTMLEPCWEVVDENDLEFEFIHQSLQEVLAALYACARPAEEFGRILDDVLKKDEIKEVQKFVYGLIMDDRLQSKVKDYFSAPEPPKNLEISLAADEPENSLFVKFEDENTVNRKYEIITTSLSDGIEIKLETDDTSAKVDGLTPGERYTVRVFSVRNDVRSEPCVAEEPIRLFPSKVTNVDVVKISMLIYKISWNRTQGAETYMVRWRHNTDDEMKEMSTAGTECSLDKLTPGESYQIHVVAANTAGYGRCSETKNLNIGVIPPKKVTVQAKHNDGSVSLEVAFTNVTQKIKEYIVGDEHNLFYKVRIQGTHTVIRNLALGKTYRVYVKAVGKNGLESAKRLAAPVCIGPLGVSQRCSHPRQNQIPALLMGLTVADGVIYNRERDAPGQNCKYIPPGYHHQEKYRLSTFSEYPSDVPVKVTDMAAAGFYYTGYKDRVKCFSCGLAVENWMVGDDAMERRWHKTDCKMAAEQDTRNDPIPTPNFRSIFRLIAGKHNNVQGISSLALGHRNYAQAPQGSSGLSNLSGASGSSLPNEITDVTSNFRRVVNVTDSYPSLVLANVLSVEHENRLKSLVLKNEKDRRTTFLKWPSYPAPYLPSDLAKDGFFYLGNLDRTQCFSCSGVLRNWAPYDSVREQHAKHFPNCRIVRAMDSGNIPMTDEERRDADEADRMRIAALLPSAGSLVEPPDPTEEEQRHLAAYFPCRDAVNPHMSRIQKRIETFAQGWPRERIRAAPEAIAKAGFYFLGESDKTKCFYCNGGLQNWDPDDEPWTEHAKWFPGCEFVLRRKGVEFVRQLVESHPNLNRPYIRNPVSLDIPPRDVQRTSPPNSMETQQSRLNLEQVQNMGFSMERIQRAIQRKEASGGYANTQELILDLAEENDVGTENNDMETAAAAPMEHSNNIEHGPAPILAQAGNKREGGAEGLGGTSVKKTKTSTVNGVQDSDDRQMQESLNAFEQTDKCKRCKQNRAEVVLIPCGHLSACSNCALVIKRCPICDVKVASSMKVFRA